MKKKIRLSNKKKVFNYKAPVDIDNIKYKPSINFTSGLHVIAHDNDFNPVIYLEDEPIIMNTREFKKVSSFFGFDIDGDVSKIYIINGEKYLSRHGPMSTKLSGVKLSKLIDGVFDNSKYVVGKFNMGSNLYSNNRLVTKTIMNYGLRKVSEDDYRLKFVKDGDFDGDTLSWVVESGFIKSLPVMCQTQPKQIINDINTKEI